MKKQLQVTLIIGIVLLLGGCAFVSTKVTPEPTLKISQLSKKQYGPLAISVIDYRHGALLGYRGLPKISGSIRITNFIHTLSSELNKIAKAYGFTPAHDSSRKLTIEVRNFTQGLCSPVSASYCINMTLVAIATNQGKEFERYYNYQIQYPYVIWEETQKEIDTHFNLGFNHLLNAIYRDHELWQFLQAKNPEVSTLNNMF